MPLWKNNTSHLSSLGGLACAAGAEVLGLVALVEDDAAVEVVATPVEDLLQPGLVLAASLALTDQCAVGGEQHAPLHVVVFKTKFKAQIMLRRNLTKNGLNENKSLI